MSSRFLIGGNGDLSALKDGSFVMNIASTVIQNLTPSLPVRTDATKQLISGLIQLSDCNFVPMTNPATSDLDMGDLAITDIAESLYTSNAAPSTPAMDMLTVYTFGDRLCYKDDTTATYTVATTTDLAAYLPLNGGTMTGSINMGGYDLSVVNQLSGSINSRDANDIISNTGSATAGRVATFSSNKIIQDGGVLLSDLATTASLSNYLLKSGGTMTGTINMDTHELNNVSAIRMTGDNVLIGHEAQTDSELTVVIGEDARVVNYDSYGAVCVGTQARSNYTMGVAIGYAALCNGAFSCSVGSNCWANAPRANGFGANITNTTADSLLLAASANIRTDSTTCDLGTVTNPFQNVFLNGSISGVVAVTATGAVSASTFAASATTASTSTTTGAIKSGGGLGVVGKAFIGNNTVIGPTQAIAQESLLTLRGPANSIAGPHRTAYVSTDQYPVSQTLNYAHGNVINYYDSYFDGTNHKSSNAGSNFAVQVASNRYNFLYDSGKAAGATLTWTTAGYMDTAGILQWQKPIKTADTTVSTSTITGAITSGGGLGVAGAAFIGGVCTAPRFVSTAPKAICIYSETLGNNAYTALTPKLANMSGFTALFNPSGEFTFNAATGQVTYTGATTQLFNIEISFCETEGISGGFIRHWISQNGSLTPIARQTRYFGTQGGYSSYTIVSVRSLATGNTIQLVTETSASQTLYTLTMQYNITPI